LTGKVGAYVVTSYDGESAVIVYARNPMEARRLGNNELGNADDERHAEVERTPEWDDGYSTRDLLDAGWHWECYGCLKRCFGSDPHVVVRDDRVFCSATCCIAALKKERAARERLWAALERAVEKLPGVEIHNIFENVGKEMVLVLFRPELGHETWETLPL
jgi:hypothetical protein